MEPTVKVALIMAVATIITQIVIAAINKKSTMEMITYKIEELTKKVQAHNNLITRMYECESKIRVLESKE